MSRPAGDQASTRRVAVQGRRARMTPDGAWRPGRACTLQFTQHPAGWLVHGWDITDVAVLISVEQAHRLVEGLSAA